MASWRIRFHDKWPHLASLYASTHQLDEEGKHPDPMMGQDNVFDPSEPYNAYRYYIQPVARSEFSIEEPTYVNRPMYKDEESRSSGYTSGDSFQRGSTCRVFLCVFLVLSFIGVVVAAVTLAVLLSKTPRPTASALVQPDIFESEASLMGREFDDKLLDKESKEFKDMSAEVCLALEQMFKDYDSPVRNEFTGCEVIEFRNGSIQAVYRLKLTPKSPGGFKDIKKVQRELETFFAKKLKQTGPWNSVKFDPKFLRRFLRVEHVFASTTTVATSTLSDTTSLSETKTTEEDISVTEQTQTSPVTTIKQTTSQVSIDSEHISSTTELVTDVPKVTDDLSDISTEATLSTNQSTESTVDTSTIYAGSAQSTEYNTFNETTETIEVQTFSQQVENETTQIPFNYENITEIMQLNETTHQPDLSTERYTTHSTEQQTSVQTEMSTQDILSTETIGGTSPNATTQAVVQTTVGAEQGETTYDVFQTTLPAKQSLTSTLTISTSHSEVSTLPIAVITKPVLTTQVTVGSPVEETTQSMDQTAESSSPVPSFNERTDAQSFISTETAIHTTSADTISYQSTQSSNITEIADHVANVTEFPYDNYTDIVGDLNFTGEYWHYETTEAQFDTGTNQTNTPIPLVTSPAVYSTERSVESTQIPIEKTTIQDSTAIDSSITQFSISETNTTYDGTTINSTIITLPQAVQTTNESKVTESIQTTLTVADVTLETTTPLIAETSTYSSAPRTTVISLAENVTSSPSISLEISESTDNNLQKMTTLPFVMTSKETKVDDILTSTISIDSQTTKHSQESTSETTEEINTVTTVSAFVAESSTKTTDSVTHTSLDEATTLLQHNESLSKLVSVSEIIDNSTDIPIDIHNDTSSYNETYTTTDTHVEMETETQSAKTIVKDVTTSPNYNTTQTVASDIEVSTSDGLHLTQSTEQPIEISTVSEQIQSSSMPDTTTILELASSETYDSTTQSSMIESGNTTVQNTTYNTITNDTETMAGVETTTISVAKETGSLSMTTIQSIESSDRINQSTVRTGIMTVSSTDSIIPNATASQSITTEASAVLGYNETTTETYVTDFETDTTTTENVSEDITTMPITLETHTTLGDSVLASTTATPTSNDTITEQTVVPAETQPLDVSTSTYVSYTTGQSNQTDATASEVNITSAVLDESSLSNDTLVSDTVTIFENGNETKIDSSNQTFNESLLNETVVIEDNYTDSVGNETHVSTNVTDLQNGTMSSMRREMVPETTFNETLMISNTSYTIVTIVNGTSNITGTLNQTSFHDTNQTYSDNVTTVPVEAVTDMVNPNVTEFYEYYENETYSWYDNSTDIYNTTEQYNATDSYIPVSTDAPVVISETVDNANTTTPGVTEVQTDSTTGVHSEDSLTTIAVE